jgi:hypothetical protein
MKQVIHELAKRFKSLFLRRRMEQEMDEELAFHQSLMRDKHEQAWTSMDKQQLEGDALMRVHEQSRRHS